MTIRDPKEKEKREQAELKQAKFENMIRLQMSTPVSRTFVAYVLDKLGYMQNIVETNASVYGKTAKQAVANDIAREIKKVCPDLFMQMESEVDKT
jgi:hypothetical protein